MASDSEISSYDGDEEQEKSEHSQPKNKKKCNKTRYTLASNTVDKTKQKKVKSHRSNDGKSFTCTHKNREMRKEGCSKSDFVEAAPKKHIRRITKFTNWKIKTSHQKIAMSLDQKLMVCISTPLLLLLRHIMLLIHFYAQII